ncbi:MAG: RnfABCDGE type electron transport complex subunit G [Prevotellaceae bacterium]|nr:RnfABCDGE type electron transport complex subunit G [Prevotellaceae bacterium]
MAKVSSFKNMLLTLLATTFISSALLAGVHQLTKKAIEKVEVEKINAGIKKVLPEFANNPSDNISKKFVDGDTVAIYKATDSEGKLIGLAVQTFTNKGYGGRISLLVGFLADGTINNIDVIAHSETPGLGDKIDPRKHPFSIQFQGKNPDTFKLQVRKDGGDVDAISATTVSSRAFCDAVARAYKIFVEEMVKYNPNFASKIQAANDAVSGATKIN